MYMHDINFNSNYTHDFERKCHLHVVAIDVFIFNFQSVGDVLIAPPPHRHLITGILFCMKKKTIKKTRHKL